MYAEAAVKSAGEESGVSGAPNKGAKGQTQERRVYQSGVLKSAKSWGLRNRGMWERGERRGTVRLCEPSKTVSLTSPKRCATTRCLLS